MKDLQLMLLQYVLFFLRLTCTYFSFSALMLLFGQQESHLGPDYKKILRLSYDVIITYDNRKSNLR